MKEWKIESSEKKGRRNIQFASIFRCRMNADNILKAYALMRDAYCPHKVVKYANIFRKELRLSSRSNSDLFTFFKRFFITIFLLANESFSHGVLTFFQNEFIAIIYQKIILKLFLINSLNYYPLL